eukprot:CAMPEP_0117045680 /NCGR_PEP_ID=MMETSP0472-20121206/31601_1 /TAXON_ID=693140 ORGANISM="Tiarina fusus, Strain LIS" /NCGR_SAMPLE_ID=MMETSP0472 /ASSEMBLY_ACC=CAM_ASM_000603 /LENGTH=440 /DNA_ID=CAMNT_0004757773 /DNA_START=675 /DNA_END=1994 /DNA_ORIENTATION=-
MDLFSVGCIIAELFSDSGPLFTYADIISYKGQSKTDDTNKFDPSAKIDKIKQKSVRKLVRQLIQLDPKARGSVSGILRGWVSMGFPSYFPELYSDILGLMKMDPDGKILSIMENFDNFKTKFRLHQKGDRSSTQLAFSPIAEHKLSSSMRFSSSSVLTSSLYGRDTESFVLNLDKDPRFDSVDLSESQLGSSTFFEEIETRAPPSPVCPNLPITEQHPGMVNLLSVVCSSIHNVVSDSIKLNAIELLVAFGENLDDKCRLQRIVPYLISLLHDPSPPIQAASITALVKILYLVNTFPPSDIKIFPEYIFPALETLMKPSNGNNDSSQDALVLCALAKNIASFAELSGRFISAKKYLSESTVLSQPSLDSSLSEDFIERIFVKRFISVLSEDRENEQALLCDIRCAILDRITGLAQFLGQEITTNFLIPKLREFLRSGPTW